MDKSAIKNFAVRARIKLIEDITQKTYELGISPDEIKGVDIFEGGFKIKGLINSKTYKSYEKRQRDKLLTKIEEKGYKQVIEEVAYTWFNRFIALRFMEVNEYLPTGIRVLSSKDEGKTEPDIIKEAVNIDLDVDKEIVYKLVDANDTDDLFKYLLIKQCNQLGQIMPMVFEEISDYTELLLPDNLLAEGSIIRDLVEKIDEQDYKDQVEIIGWMYQYYISEKKDEVFSDLKLNKKISKEDIPAATQLFTPKWIVKYMIENSLGRLWLESHPNVELQAKWKYFLEEAEQDVEVQNKLDELINPYLKPEDIKVFDPSCGSGHILVYAFDVLYDIYLGDNYAEREIPQLILEKNLFGLDIDDRAGQLAAFALMMKARNKNRRIFRKKIELNICSIQESNSIPKQAIDFLLKPNNMSIDQSICRDDIKSLIQIFNDAKDYGSILHVKELDFNAIERKIDEIRNGDTVDLFEFQYKEIILDKLPKLIKQARIMSAKYEIVCTNPPYMGRKSMNSKLIKFIDTRFPDSKADLFAVFMELDSIYLKDNCFMSMINQHSWMFLSNFQKLRQKVIINKEVCNMIHLGSRAFEEIGGEVVQSTAYVLRNVNLNKYYGNYIRLVDYNNAKEKENKFLLSIKEEKVDYRYTTTTKDFYKIPGNPIAYWVSKKLINIFNKEIPLLKISDAKKGLDTSDNNRFLRLWYEVNFDNVELNIKDKNELLKSKVKWFTLNKGGGFRRWYGNKEYVINWEKDGKELREFEKSTIRNENYYFKKGITWSDVSTGQFSARYVDHGFLFDSTGPTLFCKEKYNEYIFLAYLNSKVFQVMVDITCPGLHYSNGTIAKMPIKLNGSNLTTIEEYSRSNVEISKLDWDSFEISWDFKFHPLLNYSIIKNNIENYKIEVAISRWSEYTNEQFEQLKYNEKELNKIFTDIYGLYDEITQDDEDKGITISKADRERDIKSFISYAVGCMFGRYSLDEDGLIFTGEQYDINRYKTFVPTKDNILVIVVDDYFEDDIVNRFVDFVKVTFGINTLEENLDYIAETLGSKTGETSRQSIRRYFLKDFYNDHVRIYSKHPIYWLFESGKENGFKALIYMHRYDISTVARVRTEYLHKLQKKYESEVKRLNTLIESDLSVRDKTIAIKKRDSIIKQIQECLVYDQVIAHVANQKVEIDLDDGVAINYEKFQNVLIPQGEGMKPLKANLLANI